MTHVVVHGRAIFWRMKEAETCPFLLNFIKSRKKMAQPAPLTLQFHTQFNELLQPM